MTEGEMVGWHHGLDGHEFESSLGVGDGQGRLACFVILSISNEYLSIFLCLLQFLFSMFYNFQFIDFHFIG